MCAAATLSQGRARTGLGATLPATWVKAYRDTRVQPQFLRWATVTVPQGLLWAAAAVIIVHSPLAPAGVPAIAANAAVGKSEPARAEAAGTEATMSESTRAESAPATEISRAALAERWAREHRDLALIDVRSAEEFAAGHLPGARNIPLDQLPARLVELSSNDEIVVYCQSGVRSAQAIDLLRGRAFKRVEHLTGDFVEWQSNGGAVETSAP